MTQPKTSKTISRICILGTLTITITLCFYVAITIFLPNFSLEAFLSVLPIILVEVAVIVFLGLWLFKMGKTSYTKRQWKIRSIILLLINLIYFSLPYLLSKIYPPSTIITNMSSAEWSMVALIIALYSGIFVILLTIDRAWILHPIKEDLKPSTYQQPNKT
ncbi:hypothetical protein A2533_02620 [Candidatus Falkowbacteria bacterium RIFOXYD2_FULL_35_9]|uniref:Uncharacterized protein n=1 Tax=Candidatus Falkowbacteria bacterium RIFOXYC2_FULL_36_12 TaxID=1798002 RepID=A0A1F5T3I7_9BACT|nr:MAG: hypothetical protein A2300_03770 [Candidatus Falkowbacteria bacterium RIFOXYB2_FULL_35_7]OGF33492.1 MAG: hypothetical protein A2478_02285 [Candidatus Falkowbacteria bacterium RIFOXYC2_FULL_36_12]OGF47760.1 MAG: hypothetical protein A2533_02620 [Candidatus Falkowbacteria bacterium RIFOXYD2_FULL_35_9]